MKTIGVSRMGMNSSNFYQNLLELVDLGDSIKVEDVNFIDNYDYILFDGGSDVSPHFYGEKNVNSYIAEYRDDYEKQIFLHYVNTPTKFVGICRGHQLLNVLYGGTLYQDLFDNHISHPNFHNIKFIENTNSILKEVLPMITQVNSLHHQAVKELAPNLYPIALEPNTSVIEVYGEIDDKVRAVQFHPEFYRAFACTNEVLKWLFRYY